MYSSYIVYISEYICVSIDQLIWEHKVWLLVYVNVHFLSASTD